MPNFIKLGAEKMVLALQSIETTVFSFSRRPIYFLISIFTKKLQKKNFFFSKYKKFFFFTFDCGYGSAAN